MNSLIEKYTNIDIKDLIEGYRRSEKRIIYRLPKPDDSDKIIVNWFESEDVKSVSKISGKTTTEITVILKENGLL